MAGAEQTGARVGVVRITAGIVAITAGVLIPELVELDLEGYVALSLVWCPAGAYALFGHRYLWRSLSGVFARLEGRSPAEV